MAQPLDLNLAIRVVDKFDGDAQQLESWLNDVDMLRTSQDTVTEENFMTFLKSRLTGAARGIIDAAPDIASAKVVLRTRFGIKLTPLAVHAELQSLTQKGNKTVGEFGSDIEKLATKLSAAWVSKEPRLFPTESATRPIVEPVAISTFISGLKDQSTAYMVKSRNPQTLTQAVSDALESQAQSVPLEVMWAGQSFGFQGNRRRGQNQRYSGNRRQYGRHNNIHNNNNNNNNNNPNNGNNNRNNYRNNGNRGNNNNYNYGNNNNDNNRNNNYRNNNDNRYGNNDNRNRNRGNGRQNANLAEEQSPREPPREQQEEANLGEFFRPQ